MITAISRAQINDSLPRAIPGLQRTLNETSLGSSWTIEDLADHLVNYAVYAFLQEESGFAGVIQVMEAPRSRNLNWFWAGKDPDNKTPIDFAEVDAFLVTAAQHFQCNKLVCDGRIGWERISKPYGYHEDGRVYVKTIE